CNRTALAKFLAGQANRRSAVAAVDEVAERVGHCINVHVVAGRTETHGDAGDVGWIVPDDPSRAVLRGTVGEVRVVAAQFHVGGDRTDTVVDADAERSDVALEKQRS